VVATIDVEEQKMKLFLGKTKRVSTLSWHWKVSTMLWHSTVCHYPCVGIMGLNVKGLHPGHWDCPWHRH